MAPRAFISFEMEDRWARDFLVQHAKDERNDIEFIDYSVQDPWDTSWKTECKTRISRTKGTIVLVGETTQNSDAVLWEIDETIQQAHHLLGIQINQYINQKIPAGIPQKNMVHWDFDQIVKWLATWT